jgi:hypothetical protein
MDGRTVDVGKRLVTCTARIASAGLNGRIETTRLPWNRPAGTVGTLVRYIGTPAPQAMWRSGTPASSKAASNEKEQPSTKATRSSRHRSAMSVTSPAGSPSRKTR